ncbi:MAG: Type II secretion system protein F [bacterium ADurb.Bin236]|nr:MAG: Type II secretion system protein F [bacterium ADurb.Bin236]
MAQYVYKARDSKGQLVSGTMDADNEQSVRSRLREKNYIATSISLKSKSMNLKEVLAKFQKVKAKNLAVFARQFSTMVNAGLSLVRALDILEKQADDKKLKEIIRDIRLRVESGASLADSFGQHPQTFSDLFINLTHAGEVGGVLDETLSRIAEFLEKDQALRAKVKSSMTYPTIIFIFAIIIVIFMLVFVLPTFTSVFENLNVTMPAMTAMLIKMSDALRGYWYVFIGFAVGAVFLFKYYTNTPKGKFQWHTLLLRVPVFGLLNKKVTVSRFSRTLGTLLSSGVPVMQALDVTGKASGNKVVERSIESVRVSIREGESISVPMEASGIFPPMVTQMIAVGEETGKLDAMLNKISEFYDMEVEATLSALTSLLEPLLMVFMGGMVGFIVVAMFMPMFQLITVI